MFALQNGAEEMADGWSAIGKRLLDAGCLVRIRIGRSSETFLHRDIVREAFLPFAEKNETRAFPALT